MTPWHILGVGAIGGLFAAHFARAHQPVALLLRDTERLAEYRARGLTLERAGHRERFTPPATLSNSAGESELSVGDTHALGDTQDEPSPIRQLLVATKAHQTTTAIDALVPRLSSDAIIVLLQNGMGVADEIRPLLPAGVRLLHALSTEGAWCRAPFHVVHAGRGLTRIGATTQQLSCAREIARQWGSADLACRAEADMRALLWRKLAINCAINPFTALYGCRNGELPAQPQWHARRARVLSEVRRVAAQDGMAEALQDIEAEIDQVVRDTAANHSSMLQDLRNGRDTEIHYLNGYIARRGADCSENAALTAALTRVTAKPTVP